MADAYCCARHRRLMLSQSRPIQGTETSDPPPGRAGDPAEVTLRLVQDHDRIAEGMNDIVVHRLFSAGLSLETALGLMGDHPGAAKVQDAIGELDLAIRDFRKVLFCDTRRLAARSLPTSALASKALS